MYARLRPVFISALYLIIWQSDGLSLPKQRLFSRQNLGVVSIDGGERRPNSSATDNITQRTFQSYVAVVAIVVTMVVPNPSYALVSTNDALATTIFNHEYSDPLHPLCKRKIAVNEDGMTFHYSGTGVKSLPGDDASVLRGCTPKEIKEFGSRQSAFDGEILSGNKITAGDGIHEGIWEPANSKKGNLGYEDKDGIRWNDGNKWVVNDKPGTEKTAGAVIAYAWLGLSAFAGVKGISERINLKPTEP